MHIFDMCTPKKIKLIPLFICLCILYTSNPILGQYQGIFQFVDNVGGKNEITQANGVAAYVDGSIYVTGFFSGTVTFGNLSITTYGATNCSYATSGVICSNDIFVAKYDAKGDILWVVHAGGGENFDFGNGIEVASDGSVYVTGSFSGTANFGSQSITSYGSNWETDIFLAKYDPNGNLQWVVQAGGTNSDYGNGITVDKDGYVYITGVFSGTATFHTTNITSYGYHDIFIAKYDNNGQFQWVVHAGGGSTRDGIAASNDGYIYLTGSFRETATFSGLDNSITENITAYGGEDVFIAKYDTSGNFYWVNHAGGQNGYDSGNSIAVGNDGSIFIVGTFSGQVKFGSKNYISFSNNGRNDIYLAKYSSSGNFQWLVQTGGPYQVSGSATGVTVDDYGNIYVSGCFGGSTTFGTISGAGIAVVAYGLEGTDDIFVCKYDPTGKIVWVTNAGGGKNDDRGTSIAIANGTNAFTVGYFSGTANFNTKSLSSQGTQDLFVAGIKQVPLCSGILGTNSSVCSRKGKCISPNTCQCSYGYSGINCEIPQCFGYNANDKRVCSGHGKCVDFNDCECVNRFIGEKCGFSMIILLVIIPVTIIIICIIIIVILYIYNNRANKKKNKMLYARLLDYELSNSEHGGPNQRLPASNLQIDIDQLVFTSKISEGASGAVYKGTWYHQVVAIKKFKIYDQVSFIREITLLNSLRHPNVLVLFGYSIDNNDHQYIITEFIENGSLDNLLHKNKMRDFGEKIKALLDIAQGMQFLHRKGIMHRDLKPQNVLIQKNGVCKLCDFGLAKFLSHTNTSGMCGTWQYMAPEIMTGTGEYNEKCDVFSFGIMMHEIFTLIRPYERETSEIHNQFAIGMQIVNGYRPFVPPEILSQRAADDNEESVISTADTTILGYFNKSNDLSKKMKNTDIVKLVKMYFGLCMSCWAEEPAQRPSFDQVVMLLESFQNFLEL
jgi:tRNA A-37 threonylcarbamoyl transferase component Bud32